MMVYQRTSSLFGDGGVVIVLAFIDRSEMDTNGSS